MIHSQEPRSQKVMKHHKLKKSGSENRGNQKWNPIFNICFNMTLGLYFLNIKTKAQVSEFTAVTLFSNACLIEESEGSKKFQNRKQTSWKKGSKEDLHHLVWVELWIHNRWRHQQQSTLKTKTQKSLVKMGFGDVRVFVFWSWCADWD